MERRIALILICLFPFKLVSNVQSYNFETNISSRINLTGYAQTSSASEAYAAYNIIVGEENSTLRLIAAAPKFKNGTSSGAILDCVSVLNSTTDWVTETNCQSLSSRHFPLTANQNSFNDALGLSLTHNQISTKPNLYTVCAPGRQKQCGLVDLFNPGACYDVNASSVMLRNWGEFQCFQNFLDVVFVIDSSNSISDSDFTIVKNVLNDIANSFAATLGDSVQIGILLYGNADNVNIAYDASTTIYYTPTKLGECMTVACFKTA
uniref:VWFA domain-containing protein n=2 Tax=Ciona intestinalis TaxID=7719 RepID=F6U0E2_CIOIN